MLDSSCMLGKALCLFVGHKYSRAPLSACMLSPPPRFNNPIISNNSLSQPQLCCSTFNPRTGYCYKFARQLSWFSITAILLVTLYVMIAGPIIGGPEHTDDYGRTRAIGIGALTKIGSVVYSMGCAPAVLHIYNATKVHLHCAAYFAYFCLFVIFVFRLLSVNFVSRLFFSFPVETTVSVSSSLENRN